MSRPWRTVGDFSMAFAEAIVPPQGHKVSILVSPAASGAGSSNLRVSPPEMLHATLEPVLDAKVMTHVHRTR
jgi:hypothetical protein